MKLKLFFILLSLINCTFSFAQREAGIWYFGEKAGLDFNSGSPVPLTNGKMGTDEGCATISDYKGNLLFYTDGSSVWNKNHQIMSGGTGLLGHNSSTQSAVIIPNPLNRNIYYIFTIDEPSRSNADDDPLTYTDDGVNDGLNYTEVNMTLNGGLGAINPSKKNIHLVTYNPSSKLETSFKASEKITAVKHNDDQSIWVITHFTDNFYTFKITVSGVNPTPIITPTSVTAAAEGYLFNAIGYLKSSPNGKKIGIVHMATRKSNEPNPKGGLVRNTGKVVLYDFDDATGKISNALTIMSGVNPYGIEFSPKTKKVYITSNDYNSSGIPQGSSLYQFNLESSPISTSKVKITTSNYIAGALQLAIDGKIYRAGYPVSISTSGESTHLSVISKPELSGNSCDYRSNYLSLNSKKVIKGLPTFIQSLFLFSFSYEFTCLGDETHFLSTNFETVDSFLWDFGDGITSTETEPNHIYGLPGTYTVTLTKIVNGETKDPLVKNIEIREKPIILNTPHQLIQCDSYDSNPNDELATFNLPSSNEALTLNNAEDYNVFFYLNETEANADVFNQNSLPNTYRNTVPNQLITAKVVYKTSNCFSLGSVELIANSSILLTPENLIGCDFGNGTAEFNLGLKKTNIISNLSLPNNLDIYFYASEEDVINNTNPLETTYISENKTIYLRAEINGVCYGAGKFDLIINYFPNINLKETINICEATFPITVSSTIPLQFQNNYHYNWSNGATTPLISISTPQEISVEIIDKTNNCVKTRSISINQVKVPTIIEVLVNSNIPSITIMTNTNIENNYFLDDFYGTPQTENRFTNIKPGKHTVFVTDNYNCGVSSQEVFVLGFPKFFTPNNDGYNDTWNIEGYDTDLYIKSNIYIFDRFGKLIIQIDPNGDGWDGFFNGKTVPSSDYWFTVELTKTSGEVKTEKGHFSLIR